LSSPFPFSITTQHKIGDTFVQTVSARDLHCFLEIGKSFSTWIADRIHQLGFVENRDYVFFFETVENPKGWWKEKKYHITLGMSMEICMIERSAKGKNLACSLCSSWTERASLKIIAYPT
jgi:phage anti-repressor protein